ncbi:MAG: signal recognition particle-docking protein FtsY [Holosporales bacterium]|jgi:fused signal recognition particle receptor|nr:signal recognition particle-docking protein FtsY [Holosporales bacterium]
MQPASWLSKLTKALKKSANSIGEGLSSVFSSQTTKSLSQEQVEEIQDVLIQNDVSFRVAEFICKDLLSKKVTSIDEAKAFLSAKILEILAPYTVPFYEKFLSELSQQPDSAESAPANSTAGSTPPHVESAPTHQSQPSTCTIVMIGVNGSGKTTTIAKLSHALLKSGLSVEWAACDTFRAAAVEQMQVWADRLGIFTYVGEKSPTTSSKQDPSARAFRAYREAKEKGTDVLFIDTAGRLQNNTQLMQELAKIVRTVQKVSNACRYVLVLDGVVGQNALAQVEMFGKVAPITDLIVTKLDGMAKAGFIIEICKSFKLNISAIGIGENLEDLGSLDPDFFAKSILGA